MSLTEFDQEQYDRNRRQGASLDGRDEGRQKDAQRSVRRQLNGR